ncbi:winged helix DNA-binding domain-containing protein [bacterium]|nr:winged helix DNA-binding domain-containing protein [bacterium]
MSGRLWHSHLLDRLSGSVGAVLDGALGVYATQPTGHLALLARLNGFRPRDLVEVVESTGVARLRTLRGSGFLIPIDLIAIVQAATRDKNVTVTRRMAEHGLVVDTYGVWADRIDDLLGSGGPMSASEIRNTLDAGEDAGAIRYVIATMTTENRLASIPVTRSWRSSGAVYTRWEDRFPDQDVWSMDPKEGSERLAERYLDRYGPATAEDLAWWSGMGKRVARAACETVAEPVSVGGVEMWSTGERGDDPPLGVRLLPVWDPLLVGYRDRSRFIDPDHMPYVYDRSGNATSVVLVDGSVAGVWDLGADDEHIEIGVAFFVAFDRSVMAGVATEAARIAEMIGSITVRVVDHGSPATLADHPSPNRFLRPLA